MKTQWDEGAKGGPGGAVTISDPRVVPAIELLKKEKPGAFVVRDSTSYRGSFGLALKVQEVPTPAQNCSGEDSSDLIRHFLIESSAKGVHLKGADEEPYFGEPLQPQAPGWAWPSWVGRVVWEGFLTQDCLSPCREPLCLCVPALHHGPGPALQTHHPKERWVWAPRGRHPDTRSVCSC